MEVSLIKTARPTRAAVLSEKDMLGKYSDRVRHGKTKKDHESGSWANRAKNQAARVEDNRSRKK